MESVSLTSAMQKYRFIADTSSNDLENKQELGIGFIFSEKETPILASSPYSTRTARGQSNLAHDVVLETHFEETVKKIRNLMALGRHGSTFCLDLMLHSRNRSVPATKKEIGNVEGDLEVKK